MSEDIRYRQHRYLIMMAIRTICFLAAILIPYFAVIFANGGREPDNVRGFMEDRMNLPAHREPPGPSGSSSASGNGTSDQPRLFCH